MVAPYIKRRRLAAAKAKAKAQAEAKPKAKAKVNKVVAAPTKKKNKAPEKYSWASKKKDS